MDVAHYADALKEQLLTAWAVAKPTALAASDAALSAASGAADLLEPMSAKVMVAQARCSLEDPHHMKGFGYKCEIFVSRSEMTDVTSRTERL